MKLSIIIPVFNEEKTIITVIKELEAVQLPNIKKEIIIVDDGSTDKTVIKITPYLTAKKQIKLIQQKSNLGKGAAINTGFQHATGNYIIIQDADLEYLPRYIPALLEPIVKKQAEVVYGTRIKRRPHLRQEERNPRFIAHYIANRVLSLLTSALYGQWITDMETGYKVFPKNAVEKMQIRSKQFEFEPEITAKLIKQGYKIKEIPITTVPRGYKEGKKLKTIPAGFAALWSIVKYRIID